MPRLARLLLVSLIMCCSGEASAQIVRYQGADGRLYFTALRLLPAPAPVTTRRKARSPPKKATRQQTAQPSRGIIYRYRTASGSIILTNTPHGPLFGITPAGFAAVKMGMSYAEVCQLLGLPTRTITETVSTWIPSSAVYKWALLDARGWDRASIAVFFEGDKVYQKRQDGLP